MSTTWPTIWIGLGAVIIGIGAYVTQRAWNEYGDARERQAIVYGLATSMNANQSLLQKAIAFSEKFEEPVVLSNPNYPPTETVMLSSALSRGVFVGSKYVPLLAQIRVTFERLETYNKSSSRQLASPEQVKNNAQKSLLEVKALASLLVDEYGQDRVRLSNDLASPAQPESDPLPHSPDSGPPVPEVEPEQQQQLSPRPDPDPQSTKTESG